MGFILALAGYALLKLVSIIEFGYFADADDGEPGLSCKDMCHTWRKLIFLTFEGTCCLILSFSCCYLSVKYWNIVYSWPIEQVTAGVFVDVRDLPITDSHLLSHGGLAGGSHTEHDDSDRH